MTFVTAIQLAG